MNIAGYFLIILSPLIIIIFFVLLYKLANHIDNIVNYYPNKTIVIDITRKKCMDNDDLLDYYIINSGTKEIEEHEKKIKDWYDVKIKSFNNNTKKIEKFKLKAERNEIKAFKIIGERTKTRYYQRNYMRYSEAVVEKNNEFDISLSDIKERIIFLKENNYSITFNGFNREDQRKALTKSLRQEIIERDNYTCQICGKYMPDGVGLHIDHIIPIASGGKSIPSNLRVLCSKCNGRKGSRQDEQEVSQFVTNNNFSEMLQTKCKKALESFYSKNIEELLKNINDIMNIECKMTQQFISYHFALNNLINIIKGSMEENIIYKNLCLELCKKDFSLFEEISSNLKFARVESITRYALINEKEGNIEEAIEACELGIKYNFIDSTNKTFDNRKQKLQNKLKK